MLHCCKLNIRKCVKTSVRKFCRSLETSPDPERLGRELAGKIRLTGPLTVAEYMREVLVNPLHGFYQARRGEEVLGGAGHFVTSPEISQMFGECLGIWYLNEWMKMGEPEHFQLVELGPGKGTLLSDILRTFARVRPAILSGLSVHLVEVSEGLRKVQRTTLCGETEVTRHGGCPVTWHSRLTEVPSGFSFFLAHEFFDVLPVHKFQKTPEGWREVLVDLDLSQEGPSFRWVISRHATPACVLLGDSVEGRDTLELCPQAGVLVSEISERLVEMGGAALMADYGHFGDQEDTLRAFRDHIQVDPLVTAGTADLTADVDFRYLKSQVGEDTVWYGPVGQGDFLRGLGIGTRCQQLLSSCNPEQQDIIMEAYNTLTSKDKMGKRFKFAAIFPASMAPIHDHYPPAGFK